MASFPITQRAEPPAPRLAALIYEAKVSVYGREHTLSCSVCGTHRSICVTTGEAADFQVVSTNLAGVALLDAEIREVLAEFLAGVDQLEAEAREAADLERQL